MHQKIASPKALARQHERLLYPRKDAAFQLGISVRSLDYLISNRKLAFQKIGKRVLIHHRELASFAARNHHYPVMDAS
jgi:excisionase family DNA binding protein